MIVLCPLFVLPSSSMIVLCLVQGVILSVCVASFPNDCVVSGPGCNIICLCCLLPLMIVLCLVQGVILSVCVAFFLQ